MFLFARFLAKYFILFFLLSLLQEPKELYFENILQTESMNILKGKIKQATVSCNSISLCELECLKFTAVKI